MRLWHQDLITRLPRQQLLGQHRECAALRGAGWGDHMRRLTMCLHILPISFISTTC